NYGYRTHSAQQVQHALQIAFGYTLPHAAEIFERDRRNAYLTSKAGGNKGLAGAYRATNHISHGQHAGVAGMDGLGRVLKLSLGLIISCDIGKVKAALHKFQQPA